MHCNNLRQICFEFYAIKRVLNRSSIENFDSKCITFQSASLFLSGFSLFNSDLFHWLNKNGPKTQNRSYHQNILNERWKCVTRKAWVKIPHIKCIFVIYHSEHHFVLSITSFFKFISSDCTQRTNIWWRTVQPDWKCFVIRPMLFDFY